jgi:hypothetical protein
MDEKGVYQGGIFLIFRDNIVAIPLQKHSLKRLRFYTAIWGQIVIVYWEDWNGLYIFFLQNVCGAVSTSHLISHVKRKPRTLDYVIFQFNEGTFCLIHVIRHGDTIEALEKASARRRREHIDDIIQI